MIIYDIYALFLTLRDFRRFHVFSYDFMSSFICENDIT
jgi:hypothetical protein